ncbi:MAG: topoisomerase C-terminal repeat-containing protein [Parvularculaceae bacterium]
MDGRYGPYIKHQKTNATLPKDLSPDAVTRRRVAAPRRAREKAANRQEKGDQEESGRAEERSRKTCGEKGGDEESACKESRQEGDKKSREEDRRRIAGIFPAKLTTPREFPRYDAPSLLRLGFGWRPRAFS